MALQTTENLHQTPKSAFEKIHARMALNTIYTEIHSDNFFRKEAHEQQFSTRDKVHCDKLFFLTDSSAA